jgi:hypothetical protein
MEFARVSSFYLHHGIEKKYVNVGLPWWVWWFNDVHHVKLPCDIPLNLLHLNNGQIVGTKTNQLFDNKQSNKETKGGVKMPQCVSYNLEKGENEVEKFLN